MGKVKSKPGSQKLKNCFAFWLAALAVGGMVVALRAQPTYRQLRDERGTQAGQDVRQLARAVDEHYNHLRSLEAEFTETYRGAGAERVESGTLWLKKPRKMRWEYRSPRRSCL